MTAQAKKIMMIIAPKDFRDEEYFEPKAIFESHGISVTTFSTAPLSVSIQGKEITPDMMLGQMDGVSFDGIVFVGGQGAQVFFSMNKALKLAQDYAQSGKITAAICIAPSILANAGLLEGKKATSHPSEMPNLEKHGAQVVDEPVVIDGNLITGKNAEAARAFGEAVAQAVLDLT